MLIETSHKQIVLEDKTKDLSQYKKLMKMVKIVLKTNQFTLDVLHNLLKICYKHR